MELYTFPATPSAFTVKSRIILICTGLAEAGVIWQLDH